MTPGDQLLADEGVYPDEPAQVLEQMQTVTSKLREQLSGVAAVADPSTTVPSARPPAASG